MWREAALKNEGASGDVSENKGADIVSGAKTEQVAKYHLTADT
jgi:hypothetical protein